jgi:hypothetical protein
MLNEQTDKEANQFGEFGPDEGRWLINMLQVRLFDDQAEKLALALGRPVDEVEGWASGAIPLDEDALMKARELGVERGLTED